MVARQHVPIGVHDEAGAGKGIFQAVRARGHPATKTSARVSRRHPKPPQNRLVLPPFMTLESAWCFVFLLEAF
jgi:hypothetical protein